MHPEPHVVELAVSAKLYEAFGSLCSFLITCEIIQVERKFKMRRTDHWGIQLVLGTLNVRYVGT